MMSCVMGPSGIAVYILYTFHQKGILTTPPPLSYCIVCDRSHTNKSFLFWVTVTMNIPLLHSLIGNSFPPRLITPSPAGIAAIGAVSFIALLLVRAGIEQNPGPGPHPPSHGYVILTGSHHQGDTSTFCAKSAGKQCVANSVIACIKASATNFGKWVQADMDMILQEGDNLYLAIKTSQDLLEIDDIPLRVHALHQQWNVHEIESFHASVDATDIEQNLQQSFGLSPSTVIILGDQSGGYAVSAMEQQGVFYIFDPHSRSSEDGLPTPHGTCILMQFATVTSMAQFVASLAQIVKATQISVSSMHITPMSLPDQGCQQQQLLKCGTCGKLCDNSTNLHRHENRCNAKDQPQPEFSCSHCGRIFNNKLKCDKHQQVCMTDRQTRSKGCCGNRRNSKQEPPQEFPCSHCGRIFNNQFNHDEHEQLCITGRKRRSKGQKGKTTHANVLPEETQCQLCGKECGNAFNLGEHHNKCIKAKSAQRKTSHKPSASSTRTSQRKGTTCNNVLKNKLLTLDPEKRAAEQAANTYGPEEPANTAETYGP